ncbi:MAG: phage integrase N-terminal SAM-like domain-containing protein, partial [Bacteroidota bacterium]
MERISVSRIQHEGRQYFLLQFSNWSLKDKVKQLPGTFYLPEFEGWLAPLSRINSKTLAAHFGSAIEIRWDAGFMSDAKEKGESEAEASNESQNRGLSKAELPVVYLQPIVHKSEARIKLIYDWDPNLNEKLKNIQGRRWSKTFGAWHLGVRFTPELLNIQFEKEIHFAWMPEGATKINPFGGNALGQQRIRPIPKPRISVILTNEQKAELNKMKEQMQLENKAHNTIRTYLSQIKLFWMYYSAKLPHEITESEIRRYLLYLVNERKVSESYHNQAINAIKFYYERILGWQPKGYYVQRPVASKRLPTVLAKEEVQDLLSVLTNLKHKAALSLMYSSGLRAGELLNLRMSDLDSDRMVILVRKGKGKKDRT